MCHFKNPYGAVRVGEMIHSYLEKSELSQAQFASRVGVRAAKMVNLLLGRNYFPLGLTKPTAEALGIDEGELTYFVLLQFHPKKDVDAAFAAICDYALSRQGETEEKSKGKASKKKYLRKKSGR